jgi:DNA-binding CsgD family transcriptional regulator
MIGERRDPGTGRFVLCETEWAAISKSLGLSPREFELTQAVVDDMTESDMARELGISTHTVHTFLKRLYRKLGVASRVQLVVRVFAEHISLRSRLEKEDIVSPQACTLSRRHLPR